MTRSTTRPSFRPRLLGLLVLLIGALPIAASGLTDFGRAAAVALSDANATVVVPAAMQLVPSAPERSVSPRRVSSGGSGTAPQISPGRSHTCALLTDGTVRCWGFNALGVLGDGTTLVRSNPVQVLTSGTAIDSPVVFSVVVLEIEGLQPGASGGATANRAALTHMSERNPPEARHTASVGIRALQQHASAVVARTAGGERIVVTDRGRPAALLIPITGAGLERLVAAGLARPARRSASEIPPPAAARQGVRSLSESLTELHADERD